MHLFYSESEVIEGIFHQVRSGTPGLLRKDKEQLQSAELIHSDVTEVNLEH